MPNLFLLPNHSFQNQLSTFSKMLFENEHTL